jgi:UDP-N-acetylmuramoyl-tripeptide--D-alanyl-D-alanine ligase
VSVRLTRAELQNVVHGQTLDKEGEHSRIGFEGVEYDSRQIRGGELFLALPGENTHGHDFLETALARGAALALVEDEALLQSCSAPERLVVVEDSLKAFWKLATWWRKELAVPAIGVTGSVGKTTVKEILACLLTRRGRGMYPQKSHNNHVGLPYTVCGIAREHGWAVLEMGMNHAGELRDLTNIACPDVAVITNVLPVHTEFFSGLDAIADAKFEIVEGLKEGGTLILRHGDEYSQKARERHDVDSRFTVLTFGDSPEADCFVSDFRSEGFDGIRFTLSLNGERQQVSMRVLGQHNSINAAAAALACKSLFPDTSLEELARGLSAFSAPMMRLNVAVLKNDKRIIDDSYNASPTSMGAALSLAADLCSDGLELGLIVGDMKELGDRGIEEHDRIGVQIAQMKPKFVIAVGEFSENLVSEAQKSGIPSFTAESPVAAAHTARKMGFDVLLVKASRGVKLDTAVETIIEMDDR